MELELLNLEKTEADKKADTLRHPIHEQAQEANELKDLMRRISKKYMEYGAATYTGSLATR
jgi:hypothetical protein